jgi:hypothetical protein
LSNWRSACPFACKSCWNSWISSLILMSSKCFDVMVTLMQYYCIYLPVDVGFPLRLGSFSFLYLFSLLILFFFYSFFFFFTSCLYWPHLLELVHSSASLYLIFVQYPICRTRFK